MKNYLFVLFAFITFLVSNSFGQSDEPVYDEFISNFKKDYLTLEMLFQVVADFQPERSFIGNNGFSLSNARLRLFGNLDDNFSYFFQASFIVSPLLLDAAIGYKFSNSFKITAGQFKTPFSKEYLTYAANIDFVNRSQASALLSPRRDIGFQFSGLLISDILEYRVGIFNGNGPNKFFNDNNSFLYVGRLAVKPRTDNSNYEIGVNAGYNNDSNSGILGESFNGKQTFIGGDVRAEIDEFLFSSEIIMNNLDGTLDSVSTIKDPFGYQVTLGYKPFTQHQFLVRYDDLSADGIIPDSKLFIIGYNFWPTRIAEIQLNYIIDSDNSAFEYHLYLINFQISL